MMREVKCGFIALTRANLPYFMSFLMKKAGLQGERPQNSAVLAEVKAPKVQVCTTFRSLEKNSNVTYDSCVYAKLI